MDKKVEKRGAKGTGAIRKEGQRRERERANSMTILELWRGRDGEDKKENKKRTRQEEEAKREEGFKRSNKIIRTPPDI